MMTFTATASNVAGTTGHFTLLNTSGEVGARPYRQSQQHCKSGSRSFTGREFHDPVSVCADGNHPLPFEIISRRGGESKPDILVPDRINYCRNDASFQLVSSITTAVFSGNGVTGSVSQGFTFTPSSVSAGNTVITCTNTSTGGCVASASKTLTIHEVPKADFTTDNTCINAADAVQFTNSTPDKSIVSSWNWNFGDPPSGSENQSGQETPLHVYTSAGSKNISLTAITNAGCADSVRKTVDFSPRPSGSFYVANDCFRGGDSTVLISNMQPASSISTYTWRLLLSNGQSEVIGDGPTVKYLLGATGGYNIQLYAESKPGCSITSQQTIYLKPTLLLAETGYDQDFENSGGQWIPSTAGATGSREMGIRNTSLRRPFTVRCMVYPRQPQHRHGPFVSLFPML